MYKKVILDNAALYDLVMLSLSDNMIEYTYQFHITQASYDEFLRLEPQFKLVLQQKLIQPGVVRVLADTDMELDRFAQLIQLEKYSEADCAAIQEAEASAMAICTTDEAVAKSLQRDAHVEVVMGLDQSV